MELKPGTYSQLTSILMESKGIWGPGFAMDDYLKFNLRVRKHLWSRENFRHLVLLDKVARIRSSVKVYGLRARARGKAIRLARISELFTPAQHRKRGFANTLMEMLLDELRKEGFDLAVLFSGIPAGFFMPYGFREIEKYDLSFDLVIPAEPRRKVMESRHKVPEAVRALYNKDRSSDFHVERSADYWDLLRYKKAQFNRLQWDRGRESLHLCEDGSAYAWTLWTGQSLTIKDAAYKRPDALADIFAHMLQRHGPGILCRVNGWLPERFERLPFVKSSRYERRKMGLFMINDLTGQNKKLLEMKPYDLQFWALDRL